MYYAIAVNEGDFFGLDVFEPLGKDNIFLVVGHSYQAELRVDISFDGEAWVSIASLFLPFPSSTSLLL